VIKVNDYEGINNDDEVINEVIIVNEDSVMFGLFD